MPSWSRIVNTTIHDFIRTVEINILRNRKFLAMMKEKGRITFNHAGDLMDWKVRYKRAPMQGYADTDTLTFSRRDRWKTAQLEWRGYAATDAMTKMERLQNKDTEAIVKIYSEIASNLMDDMDDQFGDEFYIDGTASGNSKRIHGVETFFKGTVTSAVQPIVQPNTTYAGISTVLGNYGGTWSLSGGSSTTVGWPTGTGDAHYDFWSPLIVDYTSSLTTANATGITGWTSGTKTWANTCKEAMRYGIVKGKKNKSKKGMLDMILLNDELYRLFLGANDTNERLVVQRGDKKDGLYALRFLDSINFDGVTSPTSTHPDRPGIRLLDGVPRTEVAPRPDVRTGRPRLRHRQPIVALLHRLFWKPPKQSALSA